MLTNDDSFIFICKKFKVLIENALNIYSADTMLSDFLLIYFY